MVLRFKAKKAMAFLLSVILSNLFVLIPTAFAATSVHSAAPASLYRGVSGQTAGAITIAEDAAGSLSTGTITITLPSGATFSGTQTASVLGDLALTGGNGEISFDGKTATWTVQTASATTASTITVTLQINLDATVPDGVLTASVAGGAGASGSITIANVSGAGTTSSCASPTNLFRGSSGQLAGTLSVKEKAGGALKHGGTITVSLPSGVTFYTAPGATVVGSDVTLSAPVLTGGSLATWTVTRAASTGAVDVQITSRLNVDPAYSSSDIKVDVAGTAEVTAASVKVANIVAAGTTNGCASPTSIVRGLSNQTAGTLTITENSPATLLGGGTLSLTLPSGATFTTTPTASLSSSGLTFVNTVATLSNSDRTATWTVSSISMVAATITVTPKLSLASDMTLGDLKVTVGGTAGASGGDVKIALVTTGATGTTNTCASPTTIYQGKSSQACGSVKIAENGPVVLLAGKTITVTLPSGATFASAPVASISPGNLVLTSNAATLSSGYNVATWTVQTASSSASTISFTPSVNLTSSASLGDFKITIGGTAGATSGYLKVATVKSDATGTTAACPSPSDLIQGVSNQSAAAFKISENAAGVLKTGKTIVVTLPKGATFTSAPLASIYSGNLALNSSEATLSSSSTVATWTVKTESGAASTVQITSKISLATTATLGDFKVSISGTAGVTAVDLKIGKVVNAATGTANLVQSLSTFTREGSDQKVSAILIKENGIAVLKAGKTLTMKLATGVTFASAPVAGIALGNITLQNNTASLSSGNTIATWTVKTESSTASMISVTPTINVARNAALGDLKVTIGGTAGASGTDLMIGSIADVKESVFTIGDSTYKVDGKTYAMDTVSYTSGGRTFIPVRYLAYAIGIEEGNIGWNPKTLMVTLTKGDRTVKLIIKSKYLINNGVYTTMDVAAATKNGRTVLPFRWVAEAFGAKVSWNGALKRVTIEFI